MLKLKKVAVTGGLSCGKSSVCRILKELGAYVISADNIVHQLLSTDTNLGREVIGLLGSRVVVDNRIDRSQVAQIVFQEPSLLQALENLLHPVVYSEIEKEYQRQLNNRNPPPLFVAEIPLLFESSVSGNAKEYDYVVAVVADPEICLQRFLQKPGVDREDFDNRMNRQMPLLEKAKRADYVIINSGSFSNLQETTKELYQELTENV